MKKLPLLMLTVALISCSARQTRLEDECTYTAPETRFAFWSNSAEQMEVALYSSATEESYKTIALTKGKDDFWRATVKGDLAGQYYTVRSFQGGEWSLPSPGIFAKAVSINGFRAAIIAPATTNPEGWATDVRPAMPDPTDIVVYETHLRDFTLSPYSGIENKGKFLSLTEPQTHLCIDSTEVSTGLAHLQEMGITHLQLLPFFDYGSIDETTLSNNRYNWGYDPVNYNVPEGGYSTDPYDPATRIREVKAMIHSLHASGIRVVMDVVYNHTYDAMGCALGRVVPNYFYRMNADGSFANGSGCGNETASDHEMMRRYMVESVCYWAREYHLDGFRFDLMGIHDQETMRQIRAALDEIDPTILTYGEGWSAMPPAYAYEQLAMKQWTFRMPRVGAFSDDIRNGLIGSPFDHERGFASGRSADRDAVCFGLVGGINYHDNLFGTGWSGEPLQHVSYITCHDNYCLRDRIEASAPEETEETRIRMNKLAQTTVLVSQGMSFLYGGEELYRTKQGIDNSFESPDSINIIPWENKIRYDLWQYYREMIGIRRAHKGFRLGSADLVNAHVAFLPSDNESLIIYCIKDLEGIDSAHSLIVLLNGSAEPAEADIPESSYTILAQDGNADANGLGSITASHIHIPPYSATILAESF